MLHIDPNRLARLLSLAALVGFILPVPATCREIPSSRRSRNAITRVRPTLERDLAEKGLSLGSKVFIRVFKESKELEVWVRGPERYRLFRTYALADAALREGQYVFQDP